LSEAEGYFAVLNQCDTNNLGYIASFNSLCLHINREAHVASDLNMYVKGDEPTEAEVLRALGKLKNGKAPGSAAFLVNF